jgi:LAO/AO transport system kinase
MLSMPIIHDFKTLARTISLVENSPNASSFLANLQTFTIPTIGFTGPPGAGKSSLLNAIIEKLLGENKKIGLILVDPSSPFNFGALLGDRLRLANHFNNPNLYIRSIASRGSLGGLSDKIIEIIEVMKAYPFDYIFIETVGVGQSEVEIAGIADTTVVILVPEAGDSIQAMKAGLMEIAQIFVVNKTDRPEGETMYNTLSFQLHLNGKDHIPIVKTIATSGVGVDELILELKKNMVADNNRRLYFLTEKIYKLIRENRMKNFDKEKLKSDLALALSKENFNLFDFVSKYE